MNFDFNQLIQMISTWDWKSIVVMYFFYHIPFMLMKITYSLTLDPVNDSPSEQDYNPLGYGLFVWLISLLVYHVSVYNYFYPSQIVLFNSEHMVIFSIIVFYQTLLNFVLWYTSRNNSKTRSYPIIVWVYYPIKLLVLTLLNILFMGNHLGLYQLIYHTMFSIREYHTAKRFNILLEKYFNWLWFINYIITMGRPYFELKSKSGNIYKIIYSTYVNGYLFNTPTISGAEDGTDWNKKFNKLDRMITDGFNREGTYTHAIIKNTVKNMVIRVPDHIEENSRAIDEAQIPEDDN